MPTIAYIANQFPSQVEWYVVEEIRELRRRGTRVIPCSSRQASLPDLPREFQDLARETLYLEPVRWTIVFLAVWECLSEFSLIADLVIRALFEQGRGPIQRVRALLHTLLGAYYALLLRGRGVEHIHVHHGYFSSWIAMVAARLLEVPFSMTLHGSDLLLHPSYLDTKLKHCAFCVTISEFNRQHILTHYPSVESGKIRAQRLGVHIPTTTVSPARSAEATPMLLTVGRLHSVKNHAFLLKACFFLRECGVQFRCLIVGEGPERTKLESLIHELRLEDEVALVGSVPHQAIGTYYAMADLVVLTSHSEGIPLVLMEAMAHGRVVLAPAITGIPELVIDGETGFLYEPGRLDDFVRQVERILRSPQALDGVRGAARAHVRANFDRQPNLEQFADYFLEEIARSDRKCTDEDLVLQQI